jgi:biotin--protein ligase
MTQNILIYNGPGTSSILSLMLSLQSMFSNYNVYGVNSSVIQGTEWTTKTALLIIPGGQDKPYVKDIGPIGTENIQKYVEQGGSYLGLCAGSYFASARVEFEVGREGYQVLEDRSLALTDKMSVGSVAPNFTYGSLKGADARMVRWLNHTSEMYLYVNGGGKFVDYKSETQKSKTIVEYSDGSPAIILSFYGKGKAILSGPHFEVSVSELGQLMSVLKPTNPSYIQLAQILPFLEKSEQDRRKLFTVLLNELGVTSYKCSSQSKGSTSCPIVV